MPEHKESTNKRSNEPNAEDEPDRGTQAKTGREDRAIDSTDVAEATVEGLGDETSDAQQKE